MQKLGLIDAAFLYLERAGAPMNIGSLQRFAPAGTVHDMVSFQRRLERYLTARVHAVPCMTARLKRTPLDLDQPVWVRDRNFRIDRHLYRRRLPAPGNERQLCDLVAQLHERPLRRDRPLWEMYLIDGLEDGTFAVYSKYHHSAIDGLAGQQIMDVLYSDSPQRDPRPQPAQPREGAGTARLVLDALLNLALQPALQLADAAERSAAAAKLSEQFWKDSARWRVPGAPRTRFNVRVSGYRSLALTSLPLAGVRALGRQAGASANDVFLSVCGGGLRRYLAAHRALPAASLVAGVPASLRRRCSGALGNKVGMLLAPLQTHEPDPRARLMAIADATRRAKAVLPEVRGLLQGDMHLPGLETLARSATTVAAGLPWASMVTPPCNLVISNVPGPRRTRYLLGAEMLSHHPVSIAADSVALNITAQSYGERLDVGVTACLEAVPDAAFLRDCLDASWAELQAAFPSEVVRAA